MRYLFSVILFVLIFSCKKDADVNPFDDPALDPPVDTAKGIVLDPNTFQGIHANILKPTCANSGCHDGTFEPNFTTIEGAYNMLVYHPPIKNDPSNSYQYRVDPFDADKSVIIARLTYDIDGFSGIMPLSVDPNSDWNSKKSEYIQNIRNWINDGAKDILGNIPKAGNQEPQMLGVVAFESGSSTPLPRAAGNGSIQVPASSGSVEIWFSLSDDSTAISDLTNNKIRFSLVRDDFISAPEQPLQIISSPLTEVGYLGTPVPYYHKIVINNPASYGPAGTIVYFRIYVQDSQNPITEIPKNGSYDYIKKYFSFTIQ